MIPNIVPGTNVAFGKETTAYERVCRVEWELQQVRDLLSHDEGPTYSRTQLACDIILAKAHLQTAQAYASLAGHELTLPDLKG